MGAVWGFPHRLIGVIPHCAPPSASPKGILSTLRDRAGVAERTKGPLPRACEQSLPSTQGQTRQRSPRLVRRPGGKMPQFKA